ncbi:MAG: peptidylprolyl isomerase [Polyangiales bacterium]
MLTAKVRFVSAIALVAALSACNRNGDLFLTPAPAPTTAAAAPSPLRSLLVPDPSALADGGAEPSNAPSEPAQQPAPQPTPAQPTPAPEGQPQAQAPQLQGERVHVVHVLISHTESIMHMPSITRTKEQARAFAATVLQRARNGEDFVGLARQFSDEPGHEGKGGDLGFIVRGQTVEPFERAAFALSVGAVSDVVETQFGFHIIKRIE